MVPKFVAGFLAATFTAKLPICLINPENTFLNAIPLESKQLSLLVCEKFFLFSLGFFAFAVGSIAASRFFWSMGGSETWKSKIPTVEKGFLLIIVLLLALQSMRAFLLLVLHVGAPGVVSREIFFPRLTGILNILGTRGLLVFVSGLLAWALSRRSSLALAAAVVAAVTYVTVEMAGGWRSGMFYYGLCGLWVFISSNPSKLKNRLKPFAVGFIVMAVVLFVPVMQYRNRVSRGMSPLQAVHSVLEMNRDEGEDFSTYLHKMTRRFNGLDLFVLASHGIESREMGVRSLFNGTASQFFMYGILGIPKGVVTTYGTTYWGIMSIAIGDSRLWLVGLMLGLFVGGLPVLCRRWFYTPMMQTVYECNLTIVMLGLVMGNGSFFLYFKEILISFLACLLFRTIAIGKMTYQANYPT